MSFNSGKVISSVNLVACPLPSTSQVGHYIFCNLGNTATTAQIATPDATHDVYALGYYIISTAAASPAVFLFDAAAGSAPTVATNSTGVDTAGLLHADVSATAHINSYVFPQPVKCSAGLRVTFGGGTAAGYYIVYYVVVAK